MGKIRKCSVCGHQETLYTYFCTECGGKTIEIEDTDLQNNIPPADCADESFSPDIKDEKSIELEDKKKEQISIEHEEINSDQERHVQKGINNEQKAADYISDGQKNSVYMHGVLRKGIIIGIVCVCVCIVMVMIVSSYSGREEEQQEIGNDIIQQNDLEMDNYDEQDGYLDEEINDTDNTYQDEFSDSVYSETAVMESEYVLPFSDSQYLEISDLEGLSAEECRIARNELFARHGRIFDDEVLQAYFNSKSWYSGTVLPDDFDEAVFNEYEIANRDLIVQFEKEQGYR